MRGSLTRDELSTAKVDQDVGRAKMDRTKVIMCHSSCVVQPDFSRASPGHS